MIKYKTHPTKSKRLELRLDPETYRAIVRYADSQNITKSEVVRRLCRKCGLGESREVLGRCTP